MNALDKNSPAYPYMQKMRKAIWAELDALGQAKGIAPCSDDTNTPNRLAYPTPKEISYTGSTCETYV